SIITSVFRTGRPARIDDYAALGGEIAEGVRSRGFRAAMGAPILVDGRVWGAVVGFATTAGSIRDRSEVRLGQVTDPVAVAIAKAQARDDLLRLAEEQAALRRVATLVAQAVAPDEIFAGVAVEVGTILGLPCVEVVRYDGDGTATVVGSFGTHPFAAGSHWPL